MTNELRLQLSAFMSTETSATIIGVFVPCTLHENKRKAKVNFPLCISIKPQKQIDDVKVKLNTF
jgi:hypothetical protein